MRLPKRLLLARALRSTRVDALLRRLPSWRGVAVLNYHRIGDGSRSDLHRGLFSATVEELDRQLRYVRRHFDVVTPEQFHAGPVRARGRAVMITFDDGYRDLYDAALPVLAANGIVATIFLCSGFIDGHARAWWDDIAWMLHRGSATELPRGSWSSAPLPLADPVAVENAIDLATRAYWQIDPDTGSEFLEQLSSATGSGLRPADAERETWITWEMARAIRDAGHAIGAHTVTHPILGRLSAERQREEIAGSVQRIESELGLRPRWLAYPVGVPSSFTDETTAAASAAGIELAFSNYGGIVTRDTYRPFDVRRLTVESLRDERLFAATLALPRVFAR